MNQVGQQPNFNAPQYGPGEQQQQMVPPIQYTQMAPPPYNYQFQMQQQAYNPAVVVQPGMQQTPQNAWAHYQGQIPTGCPPGLEYLAMVDQILCHQIVELLEAFTGWETNNKYVVKNSMGQQIFYVFEETDCCMRMCCNNNREFTLHVVDNMNQEVMRIFRPLKMCGGCCWFAGCCECCAHELFVESPPGTLVGSVKQAGDLCTFNYEINDAEGNIQLLIKGPCIICECCADIEFPVLTKDGAGRIGCITKQWSGLAREMFTNADNFGITFPMDLDVKTKATLLGATFLIVSVKEHN